MDESRPINHRTNSLKAAQHIMEHSKADSIEKINAMLLTLYPDDLTTVEKALIQTLNSLNQKI